MHGDDTRPWTFYAFAAFFALFVLFLYGPMIVIYILSFQGPNGGMTFPLNGVSLHWFAALQYPPAAASAVIMVIIVTLMVAGILRLVDVRKELAG